MSCKRRQTCVQNQFLSNSSQPQLKKRAVSLSQNQTPKNTNKFRIGPKIEQQEYVKLALKSLTTNFPMSQLKPFSTFQSVQKIHLKIQNQDGLFRKSNLRKRHTMYEESNSTLNRLKTTQKATFYQTKGKSFKKSKRKFKTMTNFLTSGQVDEEQHMVAEYMKDNNLLLKNQKLAFQRFNDRLKQLFPNHFQPGSAHQQSKCKSKSCNQGFFKRKKYSVQQKYDLDQPGHVKPQIKKQKKNKDERQNVNFCLFSRSKNRVMHTQKESSDFEDLTQVSNKVSLSQMNTPLKAKFQLQSKTFYKSYMRGSFYGKKKTLIEEMKIKID